MYSQTVIGRNLDRAVLNLRRSLNDSKFQYSYHSVDRVAQANAHFAELLDHDDKGNPFQKRPFRAEEARWVANERDLCRYDFEYFRSRYAKIRDISGNIILATCNVAQQVMGSVRAEAEEKGIGIDWQILKARQLGACLSPDSKVLTAELRWVEIDRLVPGDELVAVDEGPTEGHLRDYWRKRSENRRHGKPMRTEIRMRERKMRTTVVEAKWDVFDIALKITMEDGRTVLATPNHRFLAQKSGSRGFMWRKVRDLEPGDDLRTICDTWGSPDYEDGWISGMLDGEGSLNVRSSGTEVNLAQVRNAAHDRIGKYLSAGGYSFRIEPDERKAGVSSKFGSKVVDKFCVSRINEMFRLLGLTRPSRFSGIRWWEGKSLPGKSVGSTFCRIQRMEILPRQRMIDIQTKDKTFIVGGIVSHNSTDTELCIAHRAIFYSNVNAVVASSDPDKSEKMSGMIDLCFNELPLFMKPTVTDSRAGKLIGFGRQNSYITIEHGTQFTGIARGTTPDAIHLSEVSEYDNANELIDASLRKALHHSPMLFVVLESTAKGMRNWWHREWLKNKDLWPRGMSTTRPVFLPWHVGTDIWPTKTWLKQCPIPYNYEPSDAVIRHAEKCRTYVLSNDLLRKHLGGDWFLPRYQMWFYECMLEEARRKNTLNKLLEELCADDYEAFQHTGAGVFSVELIQAYRDRVKEPLGVYKLQAPVAEVPLLLQPTAGEIDPNKKPIEIRCQWNTSRPPYDYRLVPVKWNGYQEDSGLDKIYIWEFPQDNVEYVAGSDGSAGIGLDRTTIGIDKRALPGRPYAQVCEFASDKTNAVDAWPLLLALGTYYSTKQHNERRQIMCVCEVMSETDLTQLELRKRGWWNFPEWGRIDQRDMSQTSHRLGWHTTPWSRRQIIAWLISLVRNFDIEIPSPFLVEEIADLMGDEESQKIKAVHGGHDDRVLRIAFTFFASHYKVILDGTWTLDGARRFTEKNPPQLSRYVPSLAERCLTEDEERISGLISEYERHGSGFDRFGY